MTTIGLIGTGPSALYTVQALLRASHPLDIVMFEAGAVAGMGIPYNPANTDKSMLANIASIELPPIGPSLEHWLNARSDRELARLGVARQAISDRAFFPRIVLGAYFADGLKHMAADAADKGHSLRVLTRHKVLDVIPGQDDIGIVADHAGHGTVRMARDRVVIATGHRVPRKTSSAAPFREAYAATAEGDLDGNIGVLGTSLSAIDVAVAVATRHGHFHRAGDGSLCYAVDPGKMPFHVTLMSRRGVLPEADFYCPIPYLPLQYFTPAAMERLIAAGSDGLLDRAFALFQEEVTAADPAYAGTIALSRLTADDFHKAYFAPRTASNPFDWARSNLAEVRQNASARHTVAWRYAILRAHETFAEAVPQFTPADRKRFNNGLKGVFVDNYAAIPPESIERLLALHEAGCIAVQRLGASYQIGRDAAGTCKIDAGGRTRTFDHLVDARGQSALGIDDLAFPSMRLTLKANRLATRQGAAAAPDVEVEQSYRLTSGLNPVDHVYFLSLPFLLNRNPFVQGLCSAHDMGEIVAGHILAQLDETIVPDVQCDIEALRQLRDRLHVDRQPLFCLDSGLVVLS